MSWEMKDGSDLWLRQCSSFPCGCLWRQGRCVASRDLEMETRRVSVANEASMHWENDGPKQVAWSVPHPTHKHITPSTNTTSTSYSRTHSYTHVSYTLAEVLAADCFLNQEQRVNHYVVTRRRALCAEVWDERFVASSLWLGGFQTETLAAPTNGVL